MVKKVGEWKAGAVLAVVRGFAWASLTPLTQRLEADGFEIRFKHPHGGSEGAIIEALRFDEHDRLADPESLARDLVEIAKGNVTLRNFVAGQEVTA